MKPLAIGFFLILILIFGYTCQAQVITSTVSGNWSAGSTWNGGVAPTSSQSVVIANGHTVTVNTTPTTCNSFTIQGGASSTVLQIADGTKLNATSASNTINTPTNAAASSILAIGNGSLYASENINTNSTAATHGTCLITINNGFLRVKSIALGATPAKNIIKFTGAGLLSFYYGAGSITGGGTLTPSGSSTVAYEADGTQIVRDFTYDNLTIGRNNVKKISTNTTVTVRGNLLISNTSSLSLVAGTGTLICGGNWSVTSTSTNPFNEGTSSGVVIFNGTGNQSITTTQTGGETFYNLTVNKPSGSITLNSAVTTRSIVTLTSGVINSSATNLFTFNAGSSSVGANNTSYIAGPARKVGNTAFVFPVGKNNLYAPIGISAPSNIADHFTAEYFNVSPDVPLYDRTSKVATLDHISDCEYWILDRTGGTSNVSVTLSWDTRSCGVDLPTDLKVARWDGAIWQDHGNGGTTASIASGTVVTGAAVTDFSPFTLASLTVNNVLPLNLILFQANKQNKHVSIDFITDSESGILVYDVQKSGDAQNWQSLSNFNPAGANGSQNKYHLMDENPFSTTTYYRLKIIDEKGGYTYSNIQSVSLTEEVFFAIYPNPNNGSQLYIAVSDTTSKDDLFIEIIDFQGKKISFSLNESSDNRFELSMIETLAKGIYNINIINSDKVVTKRFIVE